MDILKAASSLMAAEIEKVTIDPFTSSTEAISVDDAYQIQLEQIRHKVNNGAVIVGKRLA